MVDGAVAAGASAVRWVPDRGRLASELAALVRPGDVVLTMGAGDITAVGPDLLERLERAAGVRA